MFAFERLPVAASRIPVIFIVETISTVADPPFFGLQNAAGSVEIEV